MLDTGSGSELAKRGPCPHRAPARWGTEVWNDCKGSELTAGEALCSQGGCRQGPGLVHRLHKSSSEEIQMNELGGTNEACVGDPCGQWPSRSERPVPEGAHLHRGLYQGQPAQEVRELGGRQERQQRKQAGASGQSLGAPVGHLVFIQKAT